MSARTSHRRMAGNARMGGRGRRITVTPLDFITWNVTNEDGISNTVHTLDGGRPKGYRKATLIE